MHRVWNFVASSSPLSIAGAFIALVWANRYGRLWFDGLNGAGLHYCEKTIAAATAVLAGKATGVRKRAA